MRFGRFSVAPSSCTRHGFFPKRVSRRGCYLAPLTSRYKVGIDTSKVSEVSGGQMAPFSILALDNVPRCTKLEQAFCFRACGFLRFIRTNAVESASQTASHCASNGL